MACPAEFDAYTDGSNAGCEKNVVRGVETLILDRLGFQLKLEPKCHFQDWFRIFAFTAVCG